jgi:hypothetical protein
MQIGRLILPMGRRRDHHMDDMINQFLTAWKEETNGDWSFYF